MLIYNITVCAINYILLFHICQVMINNISVAGIVAEYNPFHSGHEYHIGETKKRCGAVVAVMSGNFVQRCEPAVCDKTARAKMAVAGGADLVIGLPVRYALGSAEKFAYGAVSLLSSLGFVDVISFGSECGDIGKLREAAARIDAITPDDYRQAMKKGRTFAGARSDLSGLGQSGPNDILATEYIRALKRLGSDIEPFAVKRTDSYLESASDIRERIMNGDLSSLPASTSDILRREMSCCRAPGNIQNIERILLGFIRNADPSDFRDIYGVNEKEGFEGRILSSVPASSLEELYSMIKTKRYTMATVKRAVISAYLRIKNRPLCPVPYVHVLAFSETGREMIKQIPENVTVVSNLSKIKDVFPDFADEERRATDLFFLSTPEIGPGFSEYTRKYE